MENSYERISLYRNTARAICTSVVACPGAEAALTGALTAEAMIQNIIKTYWQEQGMIWKSDLSNRCNLGVFIKSDDFPSFPYPIVDPSLGIEGNEELTVFLEPMQDLTLRITEHKLSSQATASRTGPSDWHVQWNE